MAQSSCVQSSVDGHFSVGLGDTLENDDYGEDPSRKQFLIDLHSSQDANRPLP
jgi:hypothetical protein